VLFRSYLPSMPPLLTAGRTVHLSPLHATTTHSSTHCTLIFASCHHYTQQYALYTYLPSMPPLHTAVHTVHLSPLHATTTHSSTHCTLIAPPCHHYTQQYALYTPSSNVSCVTFSQYVQYPEQHSSLLLVNIMGTAIQYTSLLSCVTHMQREDRGRTVKQSQIGKNQPSEYHSQSVQPNGVLLYVPKVTAVLITFK
jgi:hypothetical protein